MFQFDYLAIKKKRLLLGLSQEEVATKAGVTQEIVSQVERGLNQSARTFKKLAKALKLEMEDLLFEDSTRERTGTKG
jgi:transcriptional regulator with XRE-family HTH domain